MGAAPAMAVSVAGIAMARRFYTVVAVPRCARERL